MLIARIFPRPVGAWKNATQLAKYPRILYVKPSNKMYLFYDLCSVSLGTTVTGAFAAVLPRLIRGSTPRGDLRTEKRGDEQKVVEF